MSDVNDSYHVIRCAVEAAATPRDLQTILEAAFTTKFGSAFVFPMKAQTAVSILIYNASANPLKIQSDNAVTTDNYPLATLSVRQWPAAGAFRYSLRDIFINVSVNLDPFVVEVVFE